MQLTVVRTWPSRVRAWVTQPWMLEAGGLWLGQHIIVLGLIALFQYLLLSRGFTWSSGSHGFSLLDPFLVWDNNQYVRIAQVGYSIPATSAYPPLYPLLEALFRPLFGSPALAGLAIANVAGLGACLLLRVVLDPIIGPRTSQRTLFYLLCFPTAVFFLAAYTESLFLLLGLAVFAALRRRAFWWAGALAGLAVLTHYTGACLVVPLLVVLWQERAVWWRYLSAAIAPLLLGGFWLFLTLRFHELPSTALAQGWHRESTWPWVGLVRSVAYLAVGGHTFIEMEITGRDLILTLVLLALAVGVMCSRLPLDFKAYSAAFVVFVLANPILAPDGVDALLGVPRYLLPLFPLFIPLARLSLRAKSAQLALFAVTLLVSVYLLLGFSVGSLIG